MIGLAGITGVLGLCLAAGFAADLWWPMGMRRWLDAFPRSVAAGRALSAVALLWSAWLLYHGELGRFESWKPMVYVAAPVAYVLVVIFMDELLAPRALGGILLLVPSPLLAAARWHPSPFRYVVVVFAYALVLTGIALVLSPYMFRRAMSAWHAHPRRAKAVSTAGLALAALLLLLALFVF